MRPFVRWKLSSKREEISSLPRTGPERPQK